MQLVQGRSETGLVVTRTHLFVVTALMEVGAGVALLVVPSLVLDLVLGVSGSQTGSAIARLAGVALVSLGVACWRARHDRGSAASHGLVSGLLIYNAGVVVIVLSGSFGALTPPLWAAVVLHGAMTVWCLWSSGIGRKAGVAPELLPHERTSRQLAGKQ